MGRFTFTRFQMIHIHTTLRHTGRREVDVVVNPTGSIGESRARRFHGGKTGGYETTSVPYMSQFTTHGVRLTVKGI